MMRYRFTILAIATAIISLIAVQAAFAGAQSYVDKQRVIKAGVLVPRSNTGLAAAPAAPHIFFIMSQRDDLKPHGWTFANPLAGGRDSYKNTGAYWAILLEQTTIENLAKFDVLYLSTKVAVRFQMAERDKLRRYVDGGGCLWIDNGGGMTFSTDSANAFFLPGINFESGGGTPLLMQRLHPLVTSPFWLGQDEINYLGKADYGINPGFEPDFGSLPSPMILSPVVMLTGGSGLSGDLPSIAAIEYGSGRVVVTSGFIGGRIEGPVVGGVSTLPDSLTGNNSNLMMASPYALRFAFNVVSYGTSYTSFRKEYRRTAVSSEGLGAPLVKKWDCDRIQTIGGETAPEFSPVIWKNIIFYSVGSTLYALDTTPERDLDMDGYWNDGVHASGEGTYDIIWSYTCQGKISSPTVATMLEPGSGSLAPKDFVLVTCDDGNVYVFDAFPTDPTTGNLSQSPGPRTNLWSGAMGSGSGALLPPVVQNGWICAAGPDGMVYGFSPVLSTAGSGGLDTPGHTWNVSLSASGYFGTSTVQATVKYGPILGYVKNQTNGAVVQMLSFVAEPPVSGFNSITPNDCIYSMPLYISSDRLSPINPRALETPTSGPVTFRPSYSGTMLPISSYPEPEVWAVDPTVEGNEISIPVTVNYENTSPGTVNISTTGGYLGPNTRVYMSYAIDYSKVANVLRYVPPYYELMPKITSGGSSLKLEAGATPALGPNDLFYLGVNWKTGSSLFGSPGTGKSAVYCVFFDGNRSSARLEWSYFLHGGGSMPDPNSSPGSMGGLVSLDFADPSRVWGVCAKNPSNPDEILHVQNLEVKTTPAVANDRIFVTASTSNPGPSSDHKKLSKGYLLCFKANPEFTIRLNRPLRDPTTGRPLSVRIWQPDMLFDTSAVVEPPIQAAWTVPSNMIDYDTGAITITDFNRVRLKGSSLPGVPTATITTSLPVWVFVDNQPVPLNEIDLSGWDNLLWALALPDHNGKACQGVSSSPIVLGDYVYFTDKDGYMYAVSVDATPPDNKTKILDPTSDNVDVWMPMRHSINPKGAVPGNSGRISLAGGNGILVVPASDSLYVFKNESNLVTDNHRVLEVGSDGRVSWSVDSVVESENLSGPGGASPVAAIYGVRPKALSKPLVAQKFGPSDYLVVDSGNDRIIRIDKGGQVTWSLSEFADSYKNLLRSGEPRKLKSPSDALMWSEFEKVGDEWFYVSHCLVADSGNFRVLDIVNRFVANEKLQILGPVELGPDNKPLHELNWVSYTTYKDKRFSFNSLQLVRGSGTPEDEDAIIDQVWASVSNYGLGTADELRLPESTGGGHLGGAIISMTYRESSDPFVWSYHDQGVVTGQLTTLIAPNGTEVALSGPTYFSVLNAEPMELLICDSSAVYITLGAEIKGLLTADMYGNLLTRTVTHAETHETLSDVRIPIPFSPRRAQILPNGNLLVVNSYAGKMFDPEGSKFTGEVFEVNPDFTNITWYTPNLTWNPLAPGALPGIGPGFWMQKMQNASNLDQPTSAQRLY